jgi:hypothetical protein
MQNVLRSGLRNKPDRDARGCMQAFTLKADTSRLLDLVIHSLYTRPEVFFAN